MKGLIQWLKSSSKMKRWIFLILIGIILACYGIAKVLVMKEISFKEVLNVSVAFVIGFIAIILGLIFLNKRTLEILIESSDERMENKKNVNVKSLIFNKTIYDKGPNIVVIGGGTGLNAVLAGLKNYTNNLTAIVTVSDYGKKISEARKKLDIMPLEDIKGSIIALSNKNEEVGKLFNYEFTKGTLEGFKFSDIYFSAMKEINGNFEDSIIKSNEVINMTGKVMPVTLDEMKIVAELENGYIVEERERIPEVVADKFTKINRIYLNPSNCRPTPGVIEAIKNADSIIIGPGSLYTNVIPNLLVNGVSKAIKESNAIKVYISNIMTEPGQTDSYSVSDHLNALIDHCGQGLVDYCIYDTGEVVPEFIKKYNREGQDLVDQNIEKVKGIKFLQRNLSMVTPDGHIRHDSNLISSYIIELICDDLKYQDKQNDPQYMMLNTKLKEDKRINKIKKSMKKKEKKNRKNRTKEKVKRGKSKFSNKYKERIASIKEADEKARKKMDKNIAKKLKKVEKQEKKENLKNLEEPLEKMKKVVENSNFTKEESEKPIKERPKSARGRKKTTNKTTSNTTNKTTKKPTKKTTSKTASK